jgi:phospholipid/cholesterol/gamma-HCH transport system permease protein
VKSHPRLEPLIEGDTIRVKLHGPWKTTYLEALWSEGGILEAKGAVKAAGPLSLVVVDGSQLDGLDTGGALCLRNALGDTPPTQIRFEHLPEVHIRLIQMILNAPIATHKPSVPTLYSMIADLGRSTENLLVPLYNTTAFLGLIISELLTVPFRLRRFRFNELVVQIDRALLQAIPVIGLVTFLIGIVVAYLFATQLEKYGANIIIVDSVALAMGRELSPLIVATVVAGRSGSAFTAQLGSMILTQEIDALETMGLRTLDVLIIPRVLALMFALPFLVFIGDLVSLFGSSIVASNLLQITTSSYLERLSMIQPRHFISGIIKAPFFALFIAMISCRMGLNVKPNARSVGLNTTSTVVQSIVAVIIIDAIFAILYMEIQY